MWLTFEMQSAVETSIKYMAHEQIRQAKIIHYNKAIICLQPYFVQRD